MYFSKKTYFVDLGSQISSVDLLPLSFETVITKPIKGVMVAHHNELNSAK